MSIMKVSDFNKFLSAQFPTINFYNGFVDRNSNCVGIYGKDSPYNNALGGKQNSSYSVLSLSILIHWSEDYSESELAACSIFEYLESLPAKVQINGRMSSISLKNGGPIFISRDEINKCEFVIRLDINYDR